MTSRANRRRPTPVPALRRVWLLATILAFVVPAIVVLTPVRGDDLPAGSLAPPAPPLLAGFGAITESDLRAWVTFLAAPELEGRESGVRGYDIAALYCASVLEQIGALPAGDVVGDETTYLQRFALVRVEEDAESSALELELEDGAVRFEPGKDFAVPSPAGVDFRGTTRIIVPGPGADMSISALAGDGDAPTLVVSDDGVRRYRSLSRRQFPESQFDGAQDRATVVWVSRKVAAAVFGEGAPGDGDATRSATVTTRIVRPVKQVTRTPTSNVIARIEGADPRLRHEHVVVGAHLDHVGKKDDDIFNGADDNASGSAGILAIARAFVSNPVRPRRSILLILYGAEEKGLKGSQFFVERQTVPLARIVAKINLDMIGRDEEGKDETAGENRNTVHLVGSRRHSHQLHELILELNRSVGLEFEYDQERVYRYSDQYHFGEAGIPFVFFFTGFHRDYHKPTDTVEKLNFQKMTRIVRLAYLVAHSVADLDGRLKRRRLERF